MSGESMRRGRPQDLEALLPLIAGFDAEDGHPYDEPRIRPALAPLLSDDAHGQVWVAEEGGRLVGYAVTTWGWSLESGGRECLVDELYVVPEARGIGGRLLAIALDGARAAGARRVFLESESANARVRAFYARHGFAEDDSIWMSRDLGV